MALRIVEQAGRTDVGRQRSANEDSLFVRPPLFAVADGMGGAKAGEVASAMAVEAVQGGASREPAEAQLAGIVRPANRRIYDLAVADESRAGWARRSRWRRSRRRGEPRRTWATAAPTASRGRARAAQRDHSLVAELERSGQITAEAAEHHPQRSIITRALGPEPDVEVDTYTLPGREGDVFLICSDGLTSMISDDEVTSILRSASSLDDAAEALVRAANQSGGKDNITVILFRLGEGGRARRRTRSRRHPRTTRRSPARCTPPTSRGGPGGPGRRRPDATVIHRRPEPLEAADPPLPAALPPPPPWPRLAGSHCRADPARARDRRSLRRAAARSTSSGPTTAAS